jgi:hypothetical protein
MMLQTFEMYQNGHKSRHQKALDATDWLERNGHYRDDDGFWWVGENLEIRNSWVYNGKLVIKFAEVRGNLDAERCGLTSLEGFPKVVKGGINLIDNSLTDFKDSPIWRIDGQLYASQNNLTSLEGLPRTVKTFYYHRNPELSTLEGAPIQTEVSNSPNDRTKVHDAEAMWYNDNAGSDFENRSMGLLKYLTKRLNQGVITKEDFDQLISELWWPEGFLSDELKNSVKTISRFDL